MASASHRTTILLPEELHDRLTTLARARGVSMGHLVRTAIEAQYGLVDNERRREAVQQLASLSLPVGSPEEMKAESNPFDDGPLP